MQNQDSHVLVSEMETVTPSEQTSEIDEEAGNFLLLVLTEQYAATRQTRRDVNCFFRSFMFAYLIFKWFRSIFWKHKINQKLATSQQTWSNAERHFSVWAMSWSNAERHFSVWAMSYVKFAFEDFFALFLEQLERVLSVSEGSIRFFTTGEIRKRSEFFEPFIQGLTNTSVEEFCKLSVEPMGEGSDHVHVTALSDALGVPIRIVYLDRSQFDKDSSISINVNHHDFTPAANAVVKPFITLLYRPGHYDILYLK